MRQRLVILAVLAIAGSPSVAQEAKKPLSKEERLTWAKSLEMSGDLKKSAAVLGDLQKDFPNDTSILEILANVDLQMKDFAAAAGVFEALSRLRPNEPKWPLMWAKALMWGGSHEAAYRKLQEMHRARPGDLEIARLLADAALFLKKFEEAGAIYAELSAKQTDDPALRQRAAQTLFWARQYPGAEPHYRWLIASGIATPEIRAEFAQTLNAQEKFQESIPVLEDLIRTQGEKPELLNDLLDAQMGQKEPAAAAVTCEKLLALRPTDTALQERLAEILLWAQQPAKARLHLEKVLLGRPQDDTIRRKLADCHMAEHEFAKAAELLGQLHTAHPEDIETESALTMALYLNRQPGEAKKHLRAMLERNPGDLKTVRLLAQVLMEQQEFEASIAMFRRALELGDTSRKTLLQLARALSWSKHYAEAAAIYDQLQKQEPSDWRTQREKARMLGWDRRYDEAIKDYTRILSENPDNPFAKTEMEAKTAFYDAHDATAISRYEQLVGMEDDNIEARFDLGQVYSRQSMWPEAERAYREVLDIYPGHFRARDALDQVEALSTAYSIQPRYLYHHRSSTQRLTDVRKSAFGATTSHWVTPRLEASVDYDYETFSFLGHYDVPANLYELSFDYTGHPLWDAGIRFGARDYSNSAQDHWNYDANAAVRLFDTADLTFVARRQDFIENLATFLDGVERNDYGVGLDWDVTRRLAMRTDYLYSDLTDTNEKHTLRAEARYRILWEPMRLDVGHRFESWSFHRQLDDYFSPRSFQMYSFYADWRHYLNKNELFWGTNDTYYDLGYAFGWDSQGKTTHTIEVGFHHDFSHQLNFGVDYLITRGSVYNEDLLMATFNYRFGGRKP